MPMLTHKSIILLLCDSVSGAINQLTKNLACEWATDSIRVNAVSPWAVNTQISPPVLFSHNFNMLNNSVHILKILEVARLHFERLFVSGFE